MREKLNLTENARKVIEKAQNIAIRQGTYITTPEHLLAALLDDTQIKKHLQKKYKISATALKKDLDRYFKTARTKDLIESHSFVSAMLGFDGNLILEAAFDLSEDDRVGVLDMLDAYMLYSKFPAAHILQARGFSKEFIPRGYHDADGTSISAENPDLVTDDISDGVGTGVELGVDMNSGDVVVKHRKRRSFYDPVTTGGTFLQKYCRDLNDAALKGKIDPVIGRSPEIAQVIEILRRRKKNNPILLGESGVGKTAIAEGLAVEIVTGNVPAPIRNKVLYELDVGAMIAETKYRGEFEERLKGVINDLKDNPNAILVVDEAHTLFGLGSSAESGADAVNLLKPALQQGYLRCIALTTLDEHRKFFSKDPALSRRFQPVMVDEPDIANTLKIIQKSIQHYEDFHRVSYARGSLDAAVALSARYFPNKKRPDIVYDILDVAGARKSLTLADSMKRGHVTTRDIQDVVARMKNIPIQKVGQNDRQKLNTLESDLNNAVFDQKNAAAALSDAVRQARVGLRDPEKPIGSFLFRGPTGVGKTEMAKQLAKTLEMDFIRFDMSEYMESHTVSRLIGAPPGYVGHDQAGLLTEAIDRKPSAVLLLDEIEKAHPDIFNVLLQVMDHGKLTDNNGKSVDFRNVILVMTTNTGAAEAKAKPIGFTAKSDPAGKSQEAVERLFTPEFRNRLSDSVSFDPLNESTIFKITGKFLKKLAALAAEQKVTLTWSDAAQSHLAEKGFDPEMGARPIERTIKAAVNRRLTDEILGGKLQNGGTVHLDFNEAAAKQDGPDAALDFNVESRKIRVVKAARKPASPEAKAA